MPNCCVIGGCTRNTAKNPNVSFFSFPRDPAIAKAWKRFVDNTRTDFTLSKWSRICSAHFTEDCRDFSSQLKSSLGLKSIYKLKPSSVPSLKAPSQSNVTEIDSTEQAESQMSPRPRKHLGMAFKKREKSRVLQEAFAEYRSKYGEQEPSEQPTISREMPKRKCSGTSEENLRSSSADYITMKMQDGRKRKRPRVIKKRSKTIESIQFRINWPIAHQESNKRKQPRVTQDQSRTEEGIQFRSSWPIAHT